MMDPRLFTRCRAARKAGTLDHLLMAELMDACGRLGLAARWRQEPDTKPSINHTGLEFFIREAKRHQGRIGSSRR
jgi:hypothetical protein